MSKALINRNDSSMDKIRAYYSNPEKHPLSPTVDEVRLRLTEIITLKQNYWSNQKIVKKWAIDYGLSQAQAYIDIRNSELLFGEIMKTTRQSKQAMLYEYSFQLLQRAREKGDVKAEAKALALMGKYSGIADEELMEFNPEKFENVEVSISMTKQMQELFKKLAEGGSVDFNGVDVTDIEFEDLNPKDGSTEK